VKSFERLVEAGEARLLLKDGVEAFLDLLLERARRVLLVELEDGVVDLDAKFRVRGKGMRVFRVIRIVVDGPYCNGRRERIEKCG
jgi:hypothetical protein